MSTVLTSMRMCIQTPGTHKSDWHGGHDQPPVLPVLWAETGFPSSGVNQESLPQRMRGQDIKEDNPH